MLLLLTAVLTASTMLLSPVEVVAVPGETSAAASITGIPVIELDSRPGDASSPKICAALLPDELEQLRGIPLFDAVAALDADAIAEFATAHPEVIAAAIDAQPDPRAVASWWASLSSATRDRLSDALPELIGNLDGLPFSVRDRVNRALLGEAIAQAEQDRAAAGRTVAATLDTQLEALHEIVRALGPDNAAPHRSLVSLRPGEQPTAAVALGDLDRADYVSYLVPGMFFGVRTQLVAWTDTAARLYDEQRSWLQVLAEADDTARQRRVATVAWIGYQTPDLLNVGSLDLARAGRDALARTVAGLHATRGTAEQPFVSLLAHSYGSTAALMAVSETDTRVDALALVGSPGSSATSVDELRVRAGNVFVGEAGWDPIPNSSFFGSDPGAATYGAKVMSVAGGVDIITNEALSASSGHNAYFDQGSESLRNLALIGIDRGELVTDGSSRDAGRTLALVTGPKV